MAFKEPEVRNEHIFAYREGRLQDIPPHLLEKVKQHQAGVVPAKPVEQPKARPAKPDGEAA